MGATASWPIQSSPLPPPPPEPTATPWPPQGSSEPLLWVSVVVHTRLKMSIYAPHVLPACRPSRIKHTPHVGSFHVCSSLLLRLTAPVLDVALTSLQSFAIRSAWSP
ncbi:hypothetical protein EJ05DRAFT_305559 [Pseudovirgaria hyperparasitica]|uniref:Uncharacterized protein n=1 Tax=Pseudovirgaria hyperparasitica TaxID=470096 RepID=A0A6A6WBW1_9PEZI|nr:uncharacterized protein EJ05DRAFT_305559 [Pseudovirgaria hyperparasitica]KAF2759649.1 hypothetical protein EJ05DRAFT_305559 [Pseudovirgaria hyperparasitica]